MGYYSVQSFYSLLDSVPKVTGISGGQLFSQFSEKEYSRAPSEAFIGMKIETLILRYAENQHQYLFGYECYKKLVPLIQKLYEKQQQEKIS
ncbi:unnamed protein product [Blepharisma stoltei]|uniref:Uncharacterized protein n=1 Tax=Blepharisma stoltei TaxID=1481888 RepID=A0AAU9IM70_9CILI|nr:unnamed protein product [Blepharisma stoltei]